MTRSIAIGSQCFSDIMEKNCFYVDKTYLIKEWWEDQTPVSVILRPRRFGKTLTMSMMETFFSLQYADRWELFKDLYIGKFADYKDIQGKYPVIFLSFADIKEQTYDEAVIKFRDLISKLYVKFNYLLDSKKLNNDTKEMFSQYVRRSTDIPLSGSLQYLSQLLYIHHGIRPLIFLDEYDTPMIEAFSAGYWREIVGLIKNFFNSTFKTNQYLGKALMTGITRVSKETMFSDFNNAIIFSTLSDKYATAIGFTENEVFAAMDEYGLSNRDDVKRWYDGFTFGNQTEMYNPWSIVSFLSNRKTGPYWVSTGGDKLLSQLLRHGNNKLKRQLETLIDGGNIVADIDENITYDELENGDNAVWSLLVSAGYLSVRSIYDDEDYTLSITNYETIRLFHKLIKRWFRKPESYYNEFIESLLEGNLEEMNAYMNQVALVTFSSFDTGKKPSLETPPEKFYHGFVLGLMVDLRDRFVITSNHQSGLGRYDVMLEPRDADKDDAIIIEFKVRNIKKEASLEETVSVALQQIEARKYEASLIEKGISKERIRKYGFAFEGQEVLIGDIINNYTNGLRK